MHGTLSTDENSATDIVASTGRLGRQKLPKRRFFELVNDLWPIKGAVAITQYSDVPDRTARNYQSGHSEASWSVLHDLLRGDEGYRVLKWIMAGSTTTWWAVIEHERAVYARLKALSPTLREIIDECA